MHQQSKAFRVLVADDDEDDAVLLRSAFEEAGWLVDLHFVENGEELMDYLRGRGRYSEPRSAVRPDLILLDLHMPRKGGMESLAEVKGDAALQGIPVVIFTGSWNDREIARAYALGASAFVPKPQEYEGLLAAVRTVGAFWFDLALLPSERTGH